jgi:hypothetical protein
VLIPRGSSNYKKSSVSENKYWYWTGPKNETSAVLDKKIKS